MKKIVYTAAIIALALASSTSSYAQIIDEKDVTITMDLQPILQLNMTTSDQVEFVFDDISDYIGGITKYAATVLKVSSSVNWDLYAVGNSSFAMGGTSNHWDAQLAYGTAGASSTDLIPLSALELHQDRANPTTIVTGTGNSDYNTAFSSTPGSYENSVYVNTVAGTQSTPTANDKYIAGHNGVVGTAGAVIDGMDGGTYLTQTGLTSAFYYTIDYRIIPGLPAIFPNATDDNGATADDIVTQLNGTYAQPGVYTMYVQYILLEDQ